MKIVTRSSVQRWLPARFALLWLAASAALAATPQQTFRSTVDLIPVDVQVIDAGGRPIPGLQVSDFEVTIDRKVREVVSVAFRSYGEGPPAASLPSGPRATNDAPPVSVRGEPQRVFVFAVDVASLSNTESFGLVRSLEGFVARLRADDAVGFFTLPHGPSLRPTTNRAALRQVIGTIVGGEGMRASPANLSPVEVAEIINSPANPTGSTPAGPNPRPAAPDDVLRQVQMRECGSLNDRGCTTSLIIEAETLHRKLEQEVAESIGGIRALLSGLRDYEGPKTVVLASSGMPLSDGPGGWNSGGGEARNIGEEAARSRVSIYSLHIDRGLNRTYAPQVRDIRVSTSGSRAMEERVLYDLATSSGGAMFSASVDAGEYALDRLRLETSSVYLLGVSPEKLDIDGRTHTLTVKLKSDKAGSVTRHRKFVLLRAAPRS